MQINAAVFRTVHEPLTFETVDIDNARRIYEAAHHPKSFVSLDGADHLLTRPADAAYVANVLAAWAIRYLPQATPPRPAPEDTWHGEGSVVVAETGTSRFQQRIRAGIHRLIADEPLGVGDDTGPAPYDLLLASLGSCTSMTLRMYAERQGLPLERVIVRLTHDRTHAEDCREPGHASCLVDSVERSIELQGPLTDTQRERLLAIAEKCPVHRTLTGDIRIRTQLARSGTGAAAIQRH